MGADDPFGLAAARATTLDAWRASPTRFAEDAAAEDDLATVGYRDRLITELAANAADAAADAGISGRMAIWADGDELHVANTGAPLSASGVRSMLALRVSAKVSTVDGQVGRFGVGFTATSAVADRVEVRSRSGTIVFDRSRSAVEATDAGISSVGDLPTPLLRLAWPGSQAPVDGYDTEIVLTVGDHVHTDDLLVAAHAQAIDLLLGLPGLTEITVSDQTHRITRSTNSAQAQSNRLTVTTSTASATTVRTWLEGVGPGARWLIEMVDDRPLRLTGDLLHAPTPTDVALSLPARVICELPLTPDRRHLHPDADIASAAAGYVELVRAVPSSARPMLVPRTTDSRDAVDAALIAAVLTRLADEAWLPTAADDMIAGARAVVLPDLTDDLGDVLAPLMADLAHPDVSARGRLSRLRATGVEELTLADLAERLNSVARQPDWWQRLYAALAPQVTGPVDVEELGALPIPRADGRMHIGARGMVVTEGIGTPMRWLTSVAPDADHALLERLGVERISAGKALADPGLTALVEQLDVDDYDAEPLAHEVLSTVAADPGVAVLPALSALLIPDATGELRPADELLLPDGPLAAVLVEDAPFGRVDPELVERYGAEALRRIGVGWGFSVLLDDLPVGPDHDLADEERWWDSHPEPPETLAAVRDLDLVADDRWARALTLLADDPEIAPQLLDRNGYTAWWLRHHARIDGRPLGSYGPPSDNSVAGVRDLLDHPAADQLAGALGDCRIESPQDAALVLDNLGDQRRTVRAGVAAGMHAALVRACRDGVFDPSDLQVPQRVRTLSGNTADYALVLDKPWYAQVLASSEIVVAQPSTTADAAVLAEILDLPTATDEVRAVVSDEGVAVSSADGVAVRFALLTGMTVGSGVIRVHDELWIRLDRKGTESDHRVRWWIDEQDVTHLDAQWC